MHIMWAGGEHPLQFKPAPENLISKIESARMREGGSGEECMSSEEASERKAALGAYVPPRVAAMPYSEEKERLHSLPKSQLGKTKLIRELRDEVTDFPSEILVSDYTAIINGLLCSKCRALMELSGKVRQLDETS